MSKWTNDPYEIKRISEISAQIVQHGQINKNISMLNISLLIGCLTPLVSSPYFTFRFLVFFEHGKR